MESSPLPLSELASLRINAMRTAEAAAMDEPCASQSPPPRMKSVVTAPSTELAAFQEHVLVLRQHLVGAEQSLDTADPEELRMLKKALIQVSKMISQIEAVADVLDEKRASLRNELRTLQDENFQLQNALSRERRKATNKNMPQRAQRKIKLFALRHYVSFNRLSRTRDRFPPLEENESLVDFLFDGPDNSVAMAQVAASLGDSPGPSGRARRGRGGSPTGRSPGNSAGGKHFGSARRGRGTGSARTRPRAFTRTSTGAERGGKGFSSAPVATMHDVMLLGGSAPTVTPVALTPPPPPPRLPSLGENEIDDLTQKLRNCNNKFVGKKEETSAFTIIEWNPPLD
ncbi:hypothetical protein HPB50_000435 [Hyalomma asiaticum]|uniref:Uncharacterized protein n=1 Tax=Hyalomma asiaticum TaxID=266040 RepID=A0ACB7RLJ2_HYAAI|nr:hypothetical protein HPB50_000435 [Hyalomma asiaticum]